MREISAGDDNQFKILSLPLTKHLPQKGQCDIFVNSAFKKFKQFFVYLINFVTNRHVNIRSLPFSKHPIPLPLQLSLGKI